MGRPRSGGSTFLLAVAVASLIAHARPSLAVEASFAANITGEGRYFFYAPALPGQTTVRLQPSASAELKLALKSLVTGLDCLANPYGRYDYFDSGRRLIDPHVAKCRIQMGPAAIEVGYDVQFFGVMEFVNPANVLNQRDITEDLVTRRRLGAPMASVVFPVGSGTFEAYAVGYFMPLRFPSAEGRLRPLLPVDDEATTYDSRLGRAHPELALRGTATIRDLSLALSSFSGYSPDPDFALGLSSAMQPDLVPSYHLEHQPALEAQLTLGALLLKSEDVVRLRWGGAYDSYAVGVGGEYELGALLKRDETLTFLAEYHRDSRTRNLIVPFTNDAFAGIRLGFNDRRSTELTGWASFSFDDLKIGLVAVDASTRIVEGLKVAVGYRQIVDSTGPFASIAADDYLSIRVAGYF
jgi:hypothetical protein